MFVQRITFVALLCVVLGALPLAAQTQPSGPRAELGPQATEPHPDYGTIDGNHYVNGYFGFSYRYPNGWKGNVVQASTFGTSQYALFTANPEDARATDMRYLTIVADPLPKNTTPKTFMEGALKTFASPSSGFGVLHADKNYNFGGKQFYRLDLISKSTPGSPTIYQTQVFVLLPNYAVTFSFMAGNPDDIEASVHSLESVSFEPDHSATTAAHTAKVEKSQSH